MSKKIKFISPHSETKKTELNIKKEDSLIPIFDTLAPYAKNEKGQVINNTPFYVVAKIGEFNIDEKIQSFVDDTDLYRILEKFAYNDDMTLLNVNSGFYGDISGMPDNKNDFDNYFKSNIEFFRNNYSKDIQKMILDDSKSVDDIISAFTKEYEDAVKSSQVKTEVKSEVVANE